MANGVGKDISSKSTGQFKRTGQTAGRFGNDPSVGGINNIGTENTAKELKP